MRVLLRKWFMLLRLQNGAQVLYQGQMYTINSPINLHKLLLIDHKQNTLVVKIKDLSPVINDNIDNNGAVQTKVSVPYQSFRELAFGLRCLHTY